MFTLFGHERSNCKTKARRHPWWFQDPKNPRDVCVVYLPLQSWCQSPCTGLKKSPFAVYTGTILIFLQGSRLGVIDLFHFLFQSWPEVYHYKFGWFLQNLQALFTFLVWTYCSFSPSFAELSSLIARWTWFHVHYLCIVLCFNQRAMDFAICALFDVSTKGLWILPVIDEMYKTRQSAVLRIAIAVSLQATIDLLSYLQISLLSKKIWQKK